MCYNSRFQWNSTFCLVVIYSKVFWNYFLTGFRQWKTFRHNCFLSTGNIFLSWFIILRMQRCPIDLADLSLVYSHAIWLYRNTFLHFLFCREILHNFIPHYVNILCCKMVFYALVIMEYFYYIIAVWLSGNSLCFNMGIQWIVYSIQPYMCDVAHRDVWHVPEASCCISLKQ